MALTNRVNRSGQARAWHGDFPISNRYTAGVAGERFYREIKDNGRIMGTRCPECDLVYVPAMLFCERCFTQLDDWVEVSPRGRVFTYTVLFVDLDDRPMETPAILVYIKLDGSDGGLVHYLGDVDPNDVDIGMEVEAVFKDPAERTGGIMDIAYFRPVTE
jgi:hypothetical protein